MSLETTIHWVSISDEYWEPSVEQIIKLLRYFGVNRINIRGYNRPYDVNDVENTIYPKLLVRDSSVKRVNENYKHWRQSANNISLIGYISPLIYRLSDELQTIPEAVRGSYLPHMITITIGSSIIRGWDQEVENMLICVNFDLKIIGYNNPIDVDEYLMEMNNIPGFVIMTENIYTITKQSLRIYFTNS